MPTTVASKILSRSRLALRHSRSKSWFKPFTSSFCSFSRFSGPSSAYIIRETTSAPKVIWGLSSASRATTLPVCRSASAAARVVVPMSMATPSISLAEAGESSSTTSFPTTTASPLKFHSRRRVDSSRSNGSSVLTGLSTDRSRYSARRFQSARWSFREGLLNSK